MIRQVALAIVVFAACGGDDAPAQAPQDPTATPAAAQPQAQKPDPTKQLQPRMHAEERVVCPISDKPTGPLCKPETPTCDPDLYCLGTPQFGYHCEACPERDSIRHDFKDRDFVSDQARDPFHSYVIEQPELARRGEKPKDLGPCRRSDQLIASAFSVHELKLVGIARQGTKRKVLMVDPGGYGHSIERADCVGKEKALVEDIGTDHIDFEINPEQPERGPQRPVEDYSVKLHPNEDLLPGSQPTTSPIPATLRPVVPPPSTAPVTVPPPAGAPPAAVVPPAKP